MKILRTTCLLWSYNSYNYEFGCFILNIYIYIYIYINQKSTPTNAEQKRHFISILTHSAKAVCASSTPAGQ
jgi:hypothetical protein